TLNGHREEYIKNTPFGYISLYSDCWSCNVEQRPISYVILKTLWNLSSDKSVEFVENDFKNDDIENIITKH
ncbi:9761_t:CDS:1, partial [Dentiscutata erythropus]